MTRTQLSVLFRLLLFIVELLYSIVKREPAIPQEQKDNWYARWQEFYFWAKENLDSYGGNE